MQDLADSVTSHVQTGTRSHYFPMDVILLPSFGLVSHPRFYEHPVTKAWNYSVSVLPTDLRQRKDQPM